MAYAMNQYFTRQGYVTMSVNYRSGIGYGTAFRRSCLLNQHGSQSKVRIEEAGERR